jgi:CspA family cold shock protein
MTTGKIKWFNPAKGYGFIENGTGGKDVFLHVSALEKAGIDTLQEGEEIEFEIGENKGKENAINIKKVGHEGEDNRPAEDSL